MGGHDGYLHPGFHADGTLGEIFVRMAKEGSTVSGLLDAWATAFSIALQYGAPLEKLVKILEDKRARRPACLALWIG